VSHSPKVTVFIPVYNRARFVRGAIESTLAQTYKDFELLVVDDGSTDQSIEIIKSFDDPRIRLIENKENMGLPTTRNVGLDSARGEFIALLDSDDISLPHRLARQVEFLEKHPSYAEVGAWSQRMDESGRPKPSVKLQPISAEEVRATLLFRCALKNRSVMGRTAMMRELGYRSDFARCQDYDLHARLSEHHDIGNIPEVLVLGRTHPNQWTGATTELGNTLKMRIMSELLAGLEIDPTPDELRRHFLLCNSPDTESDPQIDSDYFAWSESWFRRLIDANAKTGRYKAREFNHVIGDVRMLLALSRVGERDMSALFRYLAHPLPKGLFSTQSLSAMRLAVDYLLRRPLVSEAPSCSRPDRQHQ
jgi:glycosyltransferase involved in cell wall biosynthesis